LVGAHSVGLSMPEKDEKDLTELDWKAVLYGEALSDKTLKAGRNLALVAVATLSVSVFNLTMTAVPTLSIDFSKQPAALEMFLAVINLVLLMAYALRASTDYLRAREDWVDFVRFFANKRVKAAYVEAYEVGERYTALQTPPPPDGYASETPEQWEQHAIDIEADAKKRIAELEAQVEDRKLPRAVRHLRLLFFGVGPLLIGIFAFVHTISSMWEFFLAVVGVAGKAT